MALFDPWEETDLLKTFVLPFAIIEGLTWIVYLLFNTNSTINFFVFLLFGFLYLELMKVVEAYKNITDEED